MTEDMNFIERHLQEIQGYIASLDEQLEMIAITRQDVAEISKCPKEFGSYAALHNGIFLPATVRNDGKFLVNIGSDVLVKKTSDEVDDLLAEQEQSLLRYREKLMEEATRLYQRYFNLDDRGE